MKLLSILFALTISVAPAFASEPIMIALHEEIPVPEVQPLTAPDAPAPVVTEVKDLTYAEKHPLITAPTEFGLKVIKKTGKLTKTEKVGLLWKKTTSALSDGFVSFGKSTEKFHPGLQTVSYAGSIVTPFVIGLLRPR